QLRDERLERVALERQPEAGHRREDRCVSRRDERDPFRGDPAARSRETFDAAIPDLEPGDLAALEHVDAERVRPSRVRPGDVVVLGDPATGLERRPEYRVADVRRDVDDRADPPDVLRREPFSVDAVEPVRVDPPDALPDVA